MLEQVSLQDNQLRQDNVYLQRFFESYDTLQEEQNRMVQQGFQKKHVISSWKVYRNLMELLAKNPETAPVYKANMLKRSKIFFPLSSFTRDEET